MGVTTFELGESSTQPTSVCNSVSNHESSKVSASHGNSSNINRGLRSTSPWKCRALFYNPEDEGQRFVLSAEEEAVFEKAQKQLQAELQCMEKALSQLARQRRHLILKRKNKRKRMNVIHKQLELLNDYGRLEIEYLNLLSRRNRLYRRIHLVQKRRRQSLLQNRSNQSFPIVEFFNIGFPSCTCLHCGAVFWRYESTSSTRNHSNPSFGLCCKHGKVKLPTRRDPPQFLKTLLEGDTAESRHFRANTRGYNGIFCFISIGGKVNHSINDGKGVYVYSIGGQIYHRIGSLVPPEGVSPKFAQLYIHDPDNEVQNRMDFYSSDPDRNPLRPSIVQGLQQMLDANNVLVRTFRSARDKIAQSGVDEFQLKLFAKREGNGREYDLPTANEIAALIVDETGLETFSPDIIVQHRTFEMERISSYHPSLMPLQYPILFPYGEDGWHPNISYVQNTSGGGEKMISQCDYYSYRLQTRFVESNSLLLSGKLFQQYVVNAYALIEAERLDWMRNNQSKLRGHHYQGLVDSYLQGNSDLKLSGKPVILAASHTGSPRYKYENFQDAMAICKWIGYPDLFITFTCNSNWPEIQLMIDLIRQFTGKDPNRADVIARVFKIKLDELMMEIVDKEIFGKIRAYVNAIEWQKRGLPHAHMLFFLAPENKLHGPADIDSVICAEIPDPDLDPELHAIVTTSMMHGPCGLLRPSNSCMKNGKCSKHYPKEFCNQTTIDDNGFAKYRRRNNGRVFKCGEVELDNRWVVPYNRYLLLRFGAHINVEICNKTRAVKYLFKYINKPEDRAMATLAMQQNTQGDLSGSSNNTVVQIDEIKAFMDARYITSGEACWRIFRFDIYNQSPSVLRMSYHLPGENIVYTHENSRVQDVIEANGKTMLLAWMDLNAKSPEAHKYTFAELPQHYVWKNKEKKWQKRKRGMCIARLYYCYPSARDRYYLRMLLHVVKGCCSYEDIRTVNGITHPTFQKACYARGLLAADTEWNDCLKEVSFWATGYKLRKLFVSILIHCQVADVESFWETNWMILSDDILYSKRKQLSQPQLNLAEHTIKDLCLLSIEEILNKYSKTLADFPGLPIPQECMASLDINRLVVEELSHSSNDMYSEMDDVYTKLNVEQRIAFDNILDSVHKGGGKTFFVDGYGGTGKTFLWRAICMKLRQQGKIVLCVASSGIAALLMVGGRTAHSRFCIPINCDSKSTCHIEQGSNLAQLIQNASLIIWDEAPMAHKHSIEALDKTLRDILSTKNVDSGNKVFGGMTMVFGGDFRQTLPIIAKGTRTEIVNSSIKRSYLWRSMIVLKLTQNMRLTQNNSVVGSNLHIEHFSNWLLEIGEGRHSNVFGESIISIPPEICVHRRSDPISDIVAEIYPDLVTRHNDGNYLVERAILAPHHDTVSTVNNYVLGLFPGEEVTYCSCDSIEIDAKETHVIEEDYTVEFLNSLKIGNFPEHELKLKVGCPVILLRNMDQSTGLCNGTRMVVKRLGQWFIEVQIVTGTNVGDTVFLPRLTLSTHYKSLNFTLVRRQYPIALSYAMTINKSQGQTLKHVGLCLQKQVFSHGQLYVAMSRVTSKSGLRILSCDLEGRELKTMQNIVFTEIFE